MKGWETKKLGDATDLIARGIAPKYLDVGGIRILNQKCIRDHGINYEFARRHDDAIKNVSKDRLVRIGDGLINSTGVGTLGRVAQVREQPDEPTTVDTHVTIVRPKAGLFFPCARPPRVRKAAAMSGTLTLAELDEQIREVRANLRDLVEQETARSGAQDENRADDLIAAQEEKLARLMKEREALGG